eukprot:scaffold109674_cov18-Tisochrysis_lutea.AAC.2
MSTRAPAWRAPAKLCGPSVAAHPVGSGAATVDTPRAEPFSVGSLDFWTLAWAPSSHLPHATPTPNPRIALHSLSRGEFELVG